MNTMLINKKAVRHNKAMKSAQKTAKKRYGRVRGMISPKLRISKLAALMNEEAVSFLSNTDNVSADRMETGADITLELLLEELSAVDLRGFGGGQFSTAEKIKALIHSKISEKILLINSVECEPGLLHDEWILTHHIDEVKNGIDILSHCISFKDICLCAKTEAHEIAGNFRYIRVPNRYPMGYENQLIKSVLNLDLDKDTLPVTKGILVINIQTVLAISRIVNHSPKSNTRYMTAVNMTNATAQIIEAPMGMSFTEIAGKIFPSNSKVYVGGGLFNSHSLTKDDIVDASTCFIACGDAVEFDNKAKCKGCGGCTSKCPVGISVKNIVCAVEKGQTTGFEEYHPERCISCGACSYVCHAGKNIMEIVRAYCH